jgi:ATP-dependent RNA helicase RhlE
MDFAELDLLPQLLRALREEGYARPTPIQEQAIPEVLRGRDVHGCAQTGTGKTAAFALPILQRLHASGGPRRGRVPIRALVLSPTRELAAQIAESFSAYGRHLPITCAVIFGGVGQLPQTKALARGVDVLVATPGRLLDLCQQGLVDFGHLEVFVLDEADRMLDMGFIHDVKRVIATLPARRQTLLFAATMPRDIQELADAILRDPARVAVTPPATTVELVRQAVYFVEKDEKRALLEHVLGDRSITRTLVFTRTKHGADRVVKHLGRCGIEAQAIHGNKSQGARERALEAFKQGRTRVLVATDIAARGIDIDDVSHVINFDVPNVPETYVHRIGRTARAGASGVALSFCQEDERPFLVDIQRLIGQHIPVVEEHPHVSPLGTPRPPDMRPRGARRPPEAAPPGRRRRRGGRRRPGPRAEGPARRPRGPRDPSRA